MAQLHKSFSDDQVRGFIERYLRKEVERKPIQAILGIGKARFFALVRKYRDNPKRFSIKYARKIHPRKIDSNIEKSILKELRIEKKIIEDKSVPLKSYNYSYIKDRLQHDYQQKVSLPTIINRAKKHGFYLPNKPKRKAHDREVLTNYVGELIQHDSSHHLWAPLAQEKWYLITSIDDFSRFMLYATLLKRESSWAHIEALQAVFLKYGLPLAYYVDSHSIFRFVQGRDSLHRKHNILTDETDPQWKQVLNDCHVKVTYALSPQAKGKVERPYGWLQDRLIRNCVRENVADIKDGQRILDQELQRYNYRQVHSTTQEVPYFRFKKTLKEKKSLFREFSLKPPFLSTKDVFCLRTNRTVNAYRKISLNTLQLKVKANPFDYVNLRIYPLNDQLSEVRIWRENKLIDIQIIKKSDLKGVHF